MLFTPLHLQSTPQRANTSTGKMEKFNFSPKLRRPSFMKKTPPNEKCDGNCDLVEVTFTPKLVNSTENGAKPPNTKNGGEPSAKADLNGDFPPNQYEEPITVYKASAKAEDGAKRGQTTKSQYEKDPLAEIDDRPQTQFLNKAENTDSCYPATNPPQPKASVAVTNQKEPQRRSSEKTPPMPPNCLSPANGKEQTCCSYVIDESLSIKRGEDTTSPIKVVINSQSELTYTPHALRKRTA